MKLLCLVMGKKSPAVLFGYCLAFTRMRRSFHHCPCWKWDHGWHTDVWYHGSWICAGPVSRKGRKGIPWTLHQVLGVDQRCVLALYCCSLMGCNQSGWFFCYWFYFFGRCAVWANFHVQRRKLWCGPVVLYTISSAAILSSVAGARQMSHIIMKQFMPLYICVQTDHTWCFIQNFGLRSIHKWFAACCFFCSSGGGWAIPNRQNCPIL